MNLWTEGGLEHFYDLDSGISAGPRAVIRCSARESPFHFGSRVGGPRGVLAGFSEVPPKPSEVTLRSGQKSRPACGYPKDDVPRAVITFVNFPLVLLRVGAI